MCISDVNSWMISNKLKLNEEKTEAVLCKAQSIDTDINHIMVGSDKIVFSEKARNLGVIFDENLSMTCHVNNLCKTIHFELRRI